MNYHVFIVDKYTFKYHLEYMFAGTGAGKDKIPFLVDYNDSSLHWTTESKLTGMIADVSRIRHGDKIIFYLQATDGNPGMFYGVFTATSTAFFDENDSNNYLKDKMYKSLTFRIAIAPDCVYPKGVSEHDYLDSLNGVEYPYQMCWSLIYRKLKGNRGCTMITDYEFKSLVSKLQSVNNNPFEKDITNYSFESSSFTIKENSKSNVYAGRRDSIDIKNRMLFKANKRNAFEVHLQAYIMQNFDKVPLKNLLRPCADEPCWIGNEVSCGVGMQRIDTMIIQEKANDVYIKVVELKCVAPYMDILDRQLPWYISWVSDYVVPNYTLLGKTVHIIPCVLAKCSEDDKFIKKCRIFHQGYTQRNNIVVEQAEYIGFKVNAENIEFQKIV